MGLYDEMERLKTETGVEKEAPDEGVDIDEDDDDQEIEVASGEDKAADEPDESGDDDKEDDDKSADDDDADKAKQAAHEAYLKRREKAQAKQAQERQPQQQQAQKPQANPDEDPEPNKQENYEAWLEWKDRQIEKKVKTVDERLSRYETEQQAVQRQQRAKQAFQTLESEFASRTPDYEDVSMHMMKRIVDGLQVTNPFADKHEIARAADAHIMRLSAQFAGQGLNPVEELYHMSRDVYGYKPAEKTEKPKDKKADKFDAVVKNKRATSSGLATGGKAGDSTLTLKSTEGMTVGEIAKLRLTPAKIRQLEKMA